MGEVVRGRPVRALLRALPPRHFGDLISLASTFNEPNLPMLLKWIANIDIPFTTVLRMGRQAARAIGSNQFGCFFLGNADKLRDRMIAAHHARIGGAEIGTGFVSHRRQHFAAGRAGGGDRAAVATRSANRFTTRGWTAAAESDFFGVQVYTRCRVGKKGDLGPEPGMELTQMGYEFWPDALEACLRYAASRGAVPIYITESGVATEDDARRIDYIRRLAGRSAAVPAGRHRYPRLHSLVAAGQFRVDHGLPSEIRPGGGGPRHPAAHHQAKCALSG